MLTQFQALLDGAHLTVNCSSLPLGGLSYPITSWRLPSPMASTAMYSFSIAGRLPSEPLSDSHPRGRRSSAPSATVARAPTQFRMLGDLLKGHPPALYGSIHWAVLLASRHDLSLDFAIQEVKRPSEGHGEDRL